MKNFLSLTLVLSSFVCYIIVIFINSYLNEKDLIFYSFIGIMNFLLFAFDEIKKLIKK